METLNSYDKYPLRYIFLYDDKYPLINTTNAQGNTYHWVANKKHKNPLTY